MKVGGTSYKTIWMEGNTVWMIDQNKLPFSFELRSCQTYTKTCEAIKDMTVRGAGAIGAAAAFAMAQAFQEAPKENTEAFVKKAKSVIEATRPTARNLFYATEKVFLAGSVSVKDAISEAQNVANQDIADSRAIGDFGSKLIADGAAILTHCNAGWLAFVDEGTALSPIYRAQQQGKMNFVYVSETRSEGLPDQR